MTLPFARSSRYVCRKNVNIFYTSVAAALAKYKFPLLIIDKVCFMLLF